MVIIEMIIALEYKIVGTILVVEIEVNDRRITGIGRVTRIVWESISEIQTQLAAGGRQGNLIAPSSGKRV